MWKLQPNASIINNFIIKCINTWYGYPTRPLFDSTTLNNVIVFFNTFKIHFWQDFWQDFWHHMQMPDLYVVLSVIYLSEKNKITTITSVLMRTETYNRLVMLRWNAIYYNKRNRQIQMHQSLAICVRQQSLINKTFNKYWTTYTLELPKLNSLMSLFR